MSDNHDDASPAESSVAPQRKPVARPISHPAPQPKAQPTPRPNSRPISKPMTEPAPEIEHGDDSDPDLTAKRLSRKTDSDGEAASKEPPVEAISLLSVEAAQSEPRRKLRGLAFQAKPKGAPRYFAGYRFNQIECDMPDELPRSTIPSEEELMEQNEILRYRTPIATPSTMATFVAQAAVITHQQSLEPSKQQRPTAAAIAAFAAENQSIHARNAIANRKKLNKDGEKASEDDTDENPPVGINTMVTNSLTDASGRLSHSLIVVGGQPTDDNHRKTMLLFYLRALSLQIDSLLRIVITSNTPNGVPYAESLITWAKDVGDRGANVTRAHMLTKRSQAQAQDSIESLEETFTNMDLFIPDLESIIVEQSAGAWHPFPGTSTSFIKEDMADLRRPLNSVVKLFRVNEDWARTEGGPRAEKEARQLNALGERVQDIIDAINELLSRQPLDWVTADYRYVSWEVFMKIDYFRVRRMMGSFERFVENVEANQPIDNGDDPDWALIKHQYLVQMLDERHLEHLLEMLDWLERRLMTTHGPLVKSKVKEAMDQAAEARYRAIEARERYQMGLLQL